MKSPAQLCSNTIGIIHMMAKRFKFTRFFVVKRHEYNNFTLN